MLAAGTLMALVSISIVEISLGLSSESSAGGAVNILEFFWLAH